MKKKLDNKIFEVIKDGFQSILEHDQSTRQKEYGILFRNGVWIQLCV